MPDQPRRLLDPDRREDDQDASLRPQVLGDFTGQEAVRKNLKVFVEAAKARGEALDHVLFVGPPGLGKTTLAQIVARELGVNFRSTSGPVIAKAGDLAAQLTALDFRDVLFIDEIHRLNPAVEEILYPAMEDFQLDLIIGQGPAARSVKIDLAKFTLVGATTRAGLLTTPLRDRFGIPLRLNFYTVPELQGIVRRGARVLGIGMADEGANEIARRSRGTPRIAGRLLRRVRDFAVVDGDPTITRAVADKALKLLEVDDAGLDQMDRRYLDAVAISFGGGPVGIETIAAALSEPRDAIEDIIEPYLIQLGFVQRTPRGRMLTPHAFRHIGLAVPAQAPGPEPVRPVRSRHRAVSEGRAPHRLAVRVYYEDTDFSGVVYHANYLRFLERGRTEFLRECGIDQSDLHRGSGGRPPAAFAVRHMELDFRAAARMDDVLTVETWIEALGGASITIGQAVRRDAELLVGATVRIALVEAGRARRLLPGLIERLRPDARLPENPGRHRGD